MKVEMNKLKEVLGEQKGCQNPNSTAHNTAGNIPILCTSYRNYYTFLEGSGLIYMK